MSHVTPMNSASLAKLPKWAQEHVLHLEMRLREANRELEQHLDGRKPSEVGVQRILDDERPIAYLEPRSTVVFFLDNDHQKDDRDRLAIYLRRAYPHACEKTGPYHLEVSTSGSGYPVVQGQAANCLRVRVAEVF